jgi:hypothetical protein
VLVDYGGKTGKVSRLVLHTPQSWTLRSDTMRDRTSCWLQSETPVCW